MYRKRNVTCATTKTQTSALTHASNRNIVVSCHGFQLERQANLLSYALGMNCLKTNHETVFVSFAGSDHVRL